MKEKGAPNWIEIVRRVTPLDTGEGSMVCTVALTCSLAEVVLASVVAAMQSWLWCDCHFLCNRVWWHLSAFNSSTYFVIYLLIFRFVYSVSVNMWPGGRKKEKEHKTLRVSFWGHVQNHLHGQFPTTVSKYLTFIKIFNYVPWLVNVLYLFIYWSYVCIS